MVNQILAQHCTDPSTYAKSSGDRLRRVYKNRAFEAIVLSFYNPTAETCVSVNAYIILQIGFSSVPKVRYCIEADHL